MPTPCENFAHIINPADAMDTATFKLAKLALQLSKNLYSKAQHINTHTHTQHGIELTLIQIAHLILFNPLNVSIDYSSAVHFFLSSHIQQASSSKETLFLLQGKNKNKKKDEYFHQTNKSNLIHQNCYKIITLVHRFVFHFEIYIFAHTVLAFPSLQMLFIIFYR